MDKVSDGFHTFGDLYDHRRALMAALAKAVLLDAWKTRHHHPDDETPMFPGYFLVGINLPTGGVRYHYKLAHWDDFRSLIEVPHAPVWDGAGPNETVSRLLAWARGAEDDL